MCIYSIYIRINTRIYRYRSPKVRYLPVTTLTASHVLWSTQKGHSLLHNLMRWRPAAGSGICRAGYCKSDIMMVPLMQAVTSASWPCTSQASDRYTSHAYALPLKSPAFRRHRVYLVGRRRIFKVAADGSSNTAFAIETPGELYRKLMPNYAACICCAR